MKAPYHALFLDVGFAHCGVVVARFPSRRVVYQVCIHTEKNPKESAAQGNIRRCKEIAFQIIKLLDRYHIRLICGEFPHGGAKSARAVAQMSMATAIVALLSAVYELPLYPCTPNDLKKLIRPKGAVTKEEIQEYVQDFNGLVLPDKLKSREHIADAAACIAVLSKKFNVKLPV